MTSKPLLEFVPDQEIEIEDDNSLDFNINSDKAKPKQSLFVTKAHKSSLIDAPSGNAKPAMRTMSLANRPDTDPMQLVEQAMKHCKNPIKLSWQNVFFEVDVITSAEERQQNK